MWPLVIYFIIEVLGARTLSAYHPNYVFQSYIEIKHKFSARILVDRSVSRHLNGCHCEGNDQKMTLVGIIIHCVTVLFLILSLILLFVLPPVEMKDAIDTGKLALYAKTYNDYAVMNFAFSLLSIEAALYFINTIKIIGDRNAKVNFEKILSAIFIIMFSIFGILCFTDATDCLLATF